MAEDRDEISKRMLRFSINEFDKAKTTWDAYIFQFEQMCRVKGLSGNGPINMEARRDLLLAYVGSEHLEAIRNFIYPEDVNTKSYVDIKKDFQTLYKPTLTIFAARMEFGMAVRQEDESFTQFANRLRNLIRDCDYGNMIDEQLRDRFATGIKHSKVQMEIRQKWPDGKEQEVKVSFQKIFELALGIERAEKEVGTDVVQAVEKIHKVSERKSKKVTSRGQSYQKNIKEKECSRCGQQRHITDDSCPAKRFECYYCGKKGHFAVKCFKKNKGNKVIKQIASGEEDNSDSDEINNQETERLNHIRSVKEPSRVTIDVKLNDKPYQMEFDTGASRAIINKKIWNELNRPKLSMARKLKAYGGRQLDVKGKCTVSVQFQNQTKRLQAVVVGQDDSPLFGLPWIRAFKMLLPEGVKTIKLEEKRGKEHFKKTSKENVSPEIEQLIEEYSDLFLEELGTIKGFQARIFLKTDAKPIAFSARRIPFALRKPVENELNRLLKAGIIEKVDPSTTAIEWATPTVNVNKGNGTVRVCGDFRVTLNPNLIQDQHIMPTFTELTNRLVNGKKFSVIDLKDAYLQMEIAEDCRKYLIIATHLGYFRYKRLPFGISSGPAIYQRYMERLLKDISQVGIYLDDIIVTGKTESEHRNNLRIVFQRLRQAGIRVKLKKCRFMQESVNYLGHRLDSHGIHPSEEKVEAIKRTPAPKNVKELRSFLGAVNYHETFLPNLHGICSDLHRLSGKNERWKWTQKHEDTFQKVKDMLSSTATLVPYDETRSIIIACDASEQGLGAVLLQIMGDKQERPIAYASRTLTEVEKKYAPIDREALALIFGVTKFKMYIWGRHFILRTDHKPLERIFGEKRDLPKVINNRLIRWALNMNQYSYKIEYRNGSENVCADALSRLPLASTVQSEEEKDYIKSIRDEKFDDMALSAAKVKKATEKDEHLVKIIQYVEKGWPNFTEDDKLRPFIERKSEISVEEGVILWNGRVVIPDLLKNKVLATLHEGHPGIAAMRALSRYYVWWPKIDSDVEKWVKGCRACQENRINEAEVPLYSWNIPDGPWERVHVDFAGPFQGKQWFILVDAFSKWVEVIPMKKITSERLINKLRELFARYGVPKQLVSDNGPSFTSNEFQQFMNGNGVRHIRSTPYHPKTNGLAERFVRTFKQRFLSTKYDEVSESLKLQRFLICYRNTPHKTTGKCPAELFLGRRLPEKLDRIKPNIKDKMEWELWKQKYYHDGNAKYRSFEVGDDVWVQNERESGWRPGVVERKTGELSYEVCSAGQNKKKHADQLRSRSQTVTDNQEFLEEKKIKDMERNQSEKEREEIVPDLRQQDNLQEEYLGNSEVVEMQEEASTSQQIPLRRSSRIKKPIIRLGIDD